MTIAHKRFFSLFFFDLLRFPTLSICNIFPPHPITLVQHSYHSIRSILEKEGTLEILILLVRARCPNAPFELSLYQDGFGLCDMDGHREKIERVDGRRRCWDARCEKMIKVRL